MQDLIQIAKAHGIQGDFVGLMTAVYLDKAQICTLKHADLTVSAVITAGVGNATAAGLSQPAFATHGTINIILLIDAELSPAAMVNAVITATEAKSDVLRVAEVRAVDGLLATGTSRDCYGHNRAWCGLSVCGSCHSCWVVNWSCCTPGFRGCIGMNLRRKKVLLLALGLDLLVGDPPNRWHPVAWMGSFINYVMRKRPYDNPRAEFSFGAALVVLGSLVFGGISQLILRRLPHAAIGILFEAVALKTTFSLRGLWRAAADVEVALKQGDVQEARRLLAWHLVSRDTSALSVSATAAATIESVAENSSDGVFAPILAYALGGLPLAMVYRFVNTADAMLGYRDTAREWLGRFPARLDDVANFIPARLAAIFIVFAAQINNGKGQQSIEIMRRDAHTTASPNAGYPMAAMAGGLGVELKKRGQYNLGAGLRAPQTDDICSAKRILLLSVGLGVLLLLLIPVRKP